MQNVYESVAANKRKSWLIMILFTLFVAGAAWIFGEALGYGPSYVGTGLIFAGLISFFGYWYSDKIILSISGARPVSRKEFFDFYTVTENLCLAAQLPKPKLYVIDDSAMNAFATGRDPEHAVVCATTGILERLNRTELEGVIGHELSHVRNYDMRLMSIVTILVGMVTLLADWFIRISWFGGGRRNRDDEGGQIRAVMAILGIILALLSPIIAQLIQLAISRRREFLADASSTLLTRQPSGLINALKKLEADREPLEAANKATAHLYITNPLKNRRDNIGWFAGLFSTHPPVKERIKALETMM
ncbi:zinc metalloprotease HtpX [Candidatus Beckwithbacteria bacterium RBG_13_42_9]|uniref:Protease HtpX homolog n=1 Tax=Candidatus Beckwithbacteria bacterium RBG_13_42_9 TaxID=1797457 RepID=A0A1F5E5U6_9BACT|nr:MAG: zinc metalloprotease HtpX [Candidatus Beckwithbacteria bacterium RBG_13_42_9]